MRELIVRSRQDVLPTISAPELEELRGFTTSFPSPANLFNFAKALAFRHRPEEAEAWIAKVQKVQPTEFNPDMRRIWEAQATAQPTMAAVKWPDIDVPPVPSGAKP